MDAQAKIIFFFEQFWSFLAVALAVAVGGIAAKKVAAVLVPAERLVAAAESGRPKSGPPAGPYQTSIRPTASEIATDPKLPLWYRLWRATISTHPVIVGALAGLAPIPVAVWIPESTAAHMLWFALAGTLSGQLYEVGKRLLEIVPALVRQHFGVKSESPPPSDSPDKAPTELADTLEPDDKSAEKE
jgi:hypothetical protein